MPAKAKRRRTTPAPAPDRAPWLASRYVRLGALGIVAAAVAVTVGLVLGNGANSSPPTTQGKVKSIGPIALSASGLKNLVGQLNQVIYWLGPVAGIKYELTRTTTNDVYLRYLPPEVKAGAQPGKYLEVATYPFKGALAAVKAVDNGRPLTVAGGKGGIAAVERGTPTNVRVAYPGVHFQLEVYAPSARAARTLATSAALTPVP